MQLNNQTPFAAAALPMFITRTRSILTVIVKATFTIVPNERAQIANEQLPIFFGDEYHDPDKGGSIKFEADAVPFKRRADVVLIGNARAPLNRPVRSLKVGLRVGNLIKTAQIFGDRHWRDVEDTSPTVSLPEPFTEMPLIYENAFGGMDSETGAYCPENPVGRGFIDKRSKELLASMKLPNIEDDKHLIQAWSDKPKPAGFGFIGKNWQPRLSQLGTYDEKWQQERSPDPPPDFNADFFNGAPADQQIVNYLQGDETVDLRNLAAMDRLRFYLPSISPTVVVTTSNRHEIDSTLKPQESDETLSLNLDTLCLLPDEERFYLVWRGFRKLQDLTAKEIERIAIILEN